MSSNDFLLHLCGLALNNRCGRPPHCLSVFLCLLRFWKYDFLYEVRVDAKTV